MHEEYSPTLRELQWDSVKAKRTINGLKSQLKIYSRRDTTAITLDTL